MPEVLKKKYQYFTQADIGRLRSTGYDRPVTPLAEAVADYVHNYLETDRRLGDERASQAAEKVPSGVTWIKERSS
jgi:ADP-L-glycero-D-manno-heptose 6-epimerase